MSSHPEYAMHYSRAEHAIRNERFRRIQLLLSFVFTCFCIIGCCYQVIEILAIYFSYSVTTKIQINVPTELDAPSFSACFRYVDLMNLSAFNQKYDLDLESPLSETSVQRIQELSTKSDIFSMSPPVYDSLSSCLLRLPQNHSLLGVREAECYRLFSIQKFLIQEYVCYLFSSKINATYTYDELSYALAWPSNFYRLRMKPLFERVEHSCTKMINQLLNKLTHYK